MIPSFNQSGVLPPFVGDVTQAAQMSPYKSDLKTFVKTFHSSDERRIILIGFLNYRKKLKALGFVSGFQWIDGSFIEDVEKQQSRPPSDVDIVTFASRPSSVNTAVEWRSLIDDNRDLFTPQISKENFKCDAYFVDMTLPAETIIKQTTYWFGLFSHQRGTFLWKGMLEINLADDEDELLEELIRGGLKNAS